MSLKKAYLVILASFVWLIFGGLAFDAIHPPTNSRLADILGWSLLIGFVVIFLAGTGIWAQVKGYSPILGVVLGWAGPLGLLLLVFLPDRNAAPHAPADHA